MGPKNIIMLDFGLKMCVKATLIHSIFYDKNIWLSAQFLLWTTRLYIHFKLSLLGWRACIAYALFSAANINTKCFHETCTPLCYRDPNIELNLFCIILFDSFWYIKNYHHHQVCQPICGNIKAPDSVEFSEMKCFKRFSASNQLYSQNLECFSDNGTDN